METTDKLVIRIPKLVCDDRRTRVIRVSSDCYQQLSDLSCQTRLTMSELAGLMIEFALDRLEIIAD